jgi:hypothetical protein
MHACARAARTLVPMVEVMSSCVSTSRRSFPLIQNIRNILHESAIGNPPHHELMCIKAAGTY